VDPTLIFSLGNPKPIIDFPQLFFNLYYQPHWLESDFGRAAIKGVDKSDVISGGKTQGGGVIDSPVLGSIPPVELSTGVRTLLLARFWDDTQNYWIPGDKMGDNVYPYLVQASKEVDRDIKIRMNYLPRVPWDEETDIMFYPMRKIVKGYSSCFHFLGLHADMFWKGEGYRGY
jgi:hypothetical protein